MLGFTSCTTRHMAPALSRLPDLASRPCPRGRCMDRQRCGARQAKPHAVISACELAHAIKDRGELFGGEGAAVLPEELVFALR
ncbi:hypothetical protein M3J09_012485 [Ascochyta lentis]